MIGTGISGYLIANTPAAVIDTETTGLYPGRARVVPAQDAAHGRPHDACAGEVRDLV